jgi:hypothetical protein
MVSACEKEDKSSIGFSMKAADSGAPDQTHQQSGQDMDENGPNNDEHLVFSWETAWIYITGIDFNAEYEPQSSVGITGNPVIHFTWQGFEKVDLFSPRIFAIIELKEGHYRNIELNLTSARQNDFNGPNFYISGLYGPLFGSTPIVVEVTHTIEMEMQASEVVLTAQPENSIEGLIGISLDNLFTGISSRELDNAERVDGTILISAEHNVALYAQILENLQAKFFHEKPVSTTWDFHVRQ